jgi:hypothetical protein
MYDTDYLLGRLKSHAEWVAIEQDDGYTASIIEEAMEEIKRLRALVDAVKERE